VTAQQDIRVPIANSNPFAGSKILPSNCRPVGTATLAADHGDGDYHGPVQARQAQAPPS